MIWIIGQYADRIDNAHELLEIFLESFLDEAVDVRPRSQPERPSASYAAASLPTDTAGPIKRSRARARSCPFVCIARSNWRF